MWHGWTRVEHHGALGTAANSGSRGHVDPVVPTQSVSEFKRRESRAPRRSVGDKNSLYFDL